MYIVLVCKLRKSYLEKANDAHLWAGHKQTEGRGSSKYMQSSQGKRGRDDRNQKAVLSVLTVHPCNFLLGLLTVKGEMLNALVKL